MQLLEKVALITGAGSGIGRATAFALAQAGAKVAVLDLRLDRTEETVAELTAAGSTAMGLAADVANAAQMEAAVAQIIARWGRLDLVVANAGINGVWAPIEEITPEEWDTTLNVNLKGTFLTVKYATPYLKQQGGAIVVLSSVNGTRIFSNTGATAYSCAKAAQVAFTKMMALELAPHRVRINAICPGGVVTNIRENTDLRNVEKVRQPVTFGNGVIPLTGNQRANPEQIAELISFLLSDSAAFITGTELWIDGGQSLLQG
ncbi:MAG: SDR family oxidoreductase [Caldilineaceae bacterium]|nr:SDR family oxidoreductase [Caldilineaceae bacterium]